MPRISVELTDQEHMEFVNAKMRMKEKSLQSLMIRATHLLLSGAAKPEPKATTPTLNPSRLNPADAAYMETFLEMLSEEDEENSIRAIVLTALDRWRQDRPAPRKVERIRGVK